MTNDDIDAVIAGLTERQVDFLDRVYLGLPLSLASRPEDRARQSLRRKGIVTVLSKPRRWALTHDGLALRARLQEQQP